GKTFNKNAEVWGVKGESGFQPTCCYGCAEKFASKRGGKIIKSGSDEYFRRGDDLQKENHDLRQELTEVKKQLAEVLAELKKLRNNSEGQKNKELDQQIVKNERLIENGEKVTLS